jgi:antirestriction protein ArdC
MMEIKFKNRLKGSGLYGMIKNAEVIYQRVTSRFTAKLSEGTVASFTPYEASEAERAHLFEVERKRSQASAEAYRQNPR